MFYFTQGLKMNIDSILKVIASSGIDISEDFNSSDKSIAHLIENSYEAQENPATSGERG